jgi:hypothetical protein
MLARSLSLSWLLLALFFLQGCTQKRLDTVLCWIRPSCLPSQLPEAKAPKTQVALKRLPTPPKPKQPHKASSTTRPSKKCATSAEITIHALNPDVKVTYREPTTKADGTPLNDLRKTTIYYDFGNGRVKHKDIPASKPQGGGTVPFDQTKNVEIIDFAKIINFKISPEPIQVMICVTATDESGNESK